MTSEIPSDTTEQRALDEKPQYKTRTRFRVSEDPNYGSKHPRDEIVTAIDFHSSDPITVKQVEIEGAPVYIAYTCPVKHQYRGGQPMLIDALVTGDSLAGVELEIAKVVEDSESIKTFYKSFMAEKILPQIKGISHLIGAMGRGDVFDPGRVSTKQSDLDIMLFVDFPLSNIGIQEQFIEQLGTLDLQSEYGELGLSYSAHKITGRSVEGGEQDLITPTKRIGQVTFDLISLPEIYNLLERYPDRFRQLGDYSVKAFTQGPIVMDSENGMIHKLQERLKAL